MNEERSTSSEGTRTAAFKAFCAGERTKFLAFLPKLLLGRAHRLARKSPSIFGGTDDLIQETLLRASRREGNWHSKDHMFLWLYSALSSAAIDAKRRLHESVSGGIRPHTVPLLDHDKQVGITSVSANADRMALTEALKQLEAKHPLAFRVIELRWLSPEPLSQRDVAKLLNITQYVVRESERISFEFLNRKLN